MAYELLSGAHPFARHATPQPLIAAHLTEAPGDLRGRSRRAPAAGRAGDAVPREGSGPPPRLGRGGPRRARCRRDAGRFASGSGAVPPPVAELTGVLVAAALVLVAAVRSVGRCVPAAAPRAEEEQPSLAVLPLANLSGDQADDYFGIGLAEEITRALAKNGVRVIGRVSAGALQAKGSTNEPSRRSWASARCSPARCSGRRARSGST